MSGWTAFYGVCGLLVVVLAATSLVQSTLRWVRARRGPVGAAPHTHTGAITAAMALLGEAGLGVLRGVVARLDPGSVPFPALLDLVPLGSVIAAIIVAAASALLFGASTAAPRRPTPQRLR